MNEKQQGRILIFPRTNLFFHANRTALIVRGLIFLSIGLLALFRPVGSLAAVTVCLGVFLLLDAFAALAIAAVCRLYAGVFWALLLGATGVVSIMHPFLADQIWMFVLGVWMVITGVGELLTQTAPSRRGFLAASGILSILLGLLLASAPFIGLVIMAWMIASALILAGIWTILLVWVMRANPLLQADPSVASGESN